MAFRSARLLKAQLPDDSGKAAITRTRIFASTALSLVHAPQGWKSCLVISTMALLMHALVSYTSTLVIAMVVHAGYDFIAGIIGNWRLRTGQVEG